MTTTLVWMMATGAGGSTPDGFLQEKLGIAVEMEVTPAPLRYQTGTVRSRFAHRGCE